MRRQLAASCLVLESLVVLFAILVAKDLSDISTRSLTLLGGGLALACLLLSGLLRFRWAFAAGSLLQAVLILSGLVVPIMWFIGTMFAGMWFAFLYISAKVERQNAALERAGRAGQGAG